MSTLQMVHSSSYNIQMTRLCVYWTSLQQTHGLGFSCHHSPLSRIYLFFIWCMFQILSMRSTLLCRKTMRQSTVRNKSTARIDLFTATGDLNLKKMIHGDIENYFYFDKRKTVINCKTFREMCSFPFFLKAKWRDLLPSALQIFSSRS